MKKDIEQVAEMLFQQCRFNPDYMDKDYTRQRCRLALESLTDEEYAQVREKLMREE